MTSSATGRQVVAITGTSAHLGAALMKRLSESEGCRLIVALDPVAPAPAHPLIAHAPVDLSTHGAEEIVAAHLRDYEVDTVVHLGFLTEPTRRQEWAHEIEAIGSLKLLEACAGERVKKVIMGSSTACYGPGPKNPNFLTEEHPLRGLPGCRFMDDKVEAERLLARHAKENPEAVVTCLRMAPIIGPTAYNWFTRYLSLPAPMTLLGHDPLVQIVHESDCQEALTLAIRGEHRGAFNIVGEGVMTLSGLIRASGALSFPTPEPLARAWTSALWLGQAMAVQPQFLAFLRYLCVADGTRAKEEMGFFARCSIMDAAVEFAGDRRGVLAECMRQRR